MVSANKVFFGGAAFYHGALVEYISKIAPLALTQVKREAVC
jgi:hypothetical protein